MKEENEIDKSNELKTENLAIENIIEDCALPEATIKAPVRSEGLLDDLGEKFDPAIHLQDENGAPVFRKGGFFQNKKVFKKKNGRKKKAREEKTEIPNSALEKENYTDSAQNDAEKYQKQGDEGFFIPKDEEFRAENTEPEPEPSATIADYENTASQLVAIEEMISISVFGVGCAFLDHEKQILVSAWSRYFREKELSELPIWAELTAGHAMLLARLAQRPEPRAKVSSWRSKFKKLRFMNKLFSRKKKLAEPVEQDEGEKE